MGIKSAYNTPWAYNTKSNHLQKQKHATVWKNKIDRRVEHASLKMFYTEVVLIKNVNWNCVGKSGKLALRNVTQIIKDLPMQTKAGTIQNYLLNCGSNQIRNFTHG